MRCNNCGRKLDDGLTVCPVCNAPILDRQEQWAQDQPMPQYPASNGQQSAERQLAQSSEAKFWKTSRIIWAVLASVLVVTGTVLYILANMSKSQLIGKWRLISIDGTPISEEIIWEFSKDGVLTECAADNTISYKYSVEHKKICVKKSCKDGTDGYFTIEEQTSTLLKIKGEMVLVFDKI